MEKAITSVLLVIASVVAAIALTNSILPSVHRGAGAVLSSSSEVARRVKTDMSIIFATGATSTAEINFWVKNVGEQEITAINKSSIFLETPSIIQHVDFDSGCGGASPECWSYAFEGGATAWVQANTIKVTVRLNSLATGQHTLKFVTPNGVSAEKVFSF